MKRKCNKVLSWLLTVVMLLTSFEGFSIPVLAGEGDPTVSVQAISADGNFDNVPGKDGSSSENALTVTVSVNDPVDVSFNSAVISGNDISENAVVSWNLTDLEGNDATLPAGLEPSISGNVFTISGNATASANETYKLTASYEGAESKEIFFSIIVEEEEVVNVPDPDPVSPNKVTVSVDGFDGISAENAYSVNVSLNEAVNLTFTGAVVSGDGVVSADAIVSWNLVSGNGVDAAVLPAGLEASFIDNVYTISGNVTASANESYKLTASFNGAESEEILFTIVAEDKEVTPDPAPVSENKVTVSADGFDADGKDGSSSENALTITVSLNAPVNISFNAAVVSGDGVVSADAVVSWNLVSGNGVDAAVLPAGLEASISGNVYTISGNVTASVNETYKLTASFNGTLIKEIFFAIIVKDKEVTPAPVPVSVDRIVVSANGFEDNSKGSTSADALSVTASLNEAINLSFNAATVSANGEALSGNTVSFNLTNADGSEVTLLTGLTASENGNVFTVSGAVAASANGAYKLSVSCDGFDTVSVFFNITVKDKSQPDPGPGPAPVVKTGITIEGLEESYPYTGAKIKPAFIVMDNDRDVQLAFGADYTVSYGKNKEGSGTVTVKGKGNYTGQDVSASFKILSPAEYAGVPAGDLVASVKSVKVEKETIVYDGTAKYPAKITVKTSDGDIVMTYDKDSNEYTSSDASKTVILTFSNNVNKGTATVAATGADTKSKKKNFSIKAADLSSLGEALTKTAGDGVYADKGAVPSSFEVEYNGVDLLLGQDFTAKYANNKNAGAKGTATLKGKGNFKGSTTVDYDIVALVVDADKIAVNAVPGSKISAKSVTIADGNGAQLKKNITVTCDNTGKLKAGDAIAVTVKGDGTNVICDEVINITVGTNKKAKAKLTNKKYTVEYTGEPIDLENLDENPFEKGIITVAGLKYKDDYEVATYLNNVNKGTMTVVLKGVSSNFTGTSTVKVKIASKKMVKGE